MSYSTSTNAIESVQEFLDKLLDGEEHTFSHEAPHTLAFKIRQGIFACCHHNLEPYSHLDYTIKVRPTMVICTPKITNIDLGKPAEATAPSRHRAVYNQPLSHWDVILHLRDKTPKEIHQIQFNHFNGEATRVRAWADKNNWKVIRDKPLELHRSSQET